jgi:hypothetical protein
MTYSNPFGAEPGSGQRYRDAVIALLGQREPLEVLSETRGWLQQKLRGLDDARLRRPEAPGKWSVIEVVAHLNDAELVHGARTRYIVAEREPPLTGYDQDGWALTFGYAGADLTVTLAMFTAMREANVRLWRAFTPAQLARVGHHSERGPESCGLYLRLAAGHDLVHRRQIDRILARV